MKFLAHVGVKPAEIMRKLEAQFGDKTFKAQVDELYKHFLGRR